MTGVQTCALPICELKSESVWKSLGDYTVADGALIFLAGFTKKTTKRNYRSGFLKLTERGLIDPELSLKAFALKNHNNVVDNIKSISEWAETTKQARAALYIAYTKFLERRTDGIIKRATPSREKGKKTFREVREKVATRALNEKEYKRFLRVLEKISPVSCLIAKLLLHGCKRRNEVLGLRGSQIDFAKNEISFKQSKTERSEEHTSELQSH